MSSPSVDLNAVVASYVDETLVCSVWSSMRRAPSYQVLRVAGSDAVPALLRCLASGEGGMAVMYVLQEVTGEWPEYDDVTDEVAAGFVGFRVEDAKDAWLRWGREKGLAE